MSPEPWAHRNSKQILQSGSSMRPNSNKASPNCIFVRGRTCGLGPCRTHVALVTQQKDFVPIWGGRWLQNQVFPVFTFPLPGIWIFIFTFVFIFFFFFCRNWNLISWQRGNENFHSGIFTMITTGNLNECSTFFKYTLAFILILNSFWTEQDEDQKEVTL